MIFGNICPWILCSGCPKHKKRFSKVIHVFYHEKILLIDASAVTKLFFINSVYLHGIPKSQRCEIYKSLLEGFME